MKTRSSSGVGQKVDLEFNIESLKISDLPEDEQEQTAGANRGSSSIIANIKRKTEMQRDDPDEGSPAPKVRAQVESSKLRELLNNLGSNDEE
jgi:hypothetical protein